MMRKKMIWPAAAALVITMGVSVCQQGSSTAPSSMVKAQEINAKARADAYLKEQAGALKLPQDLSGLSYVNTVQTEAGSYVRYQQTVNGYQVFGRQLAVTVDPSGEFSLVVSDYIPYTSVEQVEDKLSKGQAESKAHKWIGDKGKGDWGTTKNTFGYVIQNGMAIPAYKVIVHAKEPFGAWETIVHAGTGKLLKKKDLNQKAIGSGHVFYPNPAESSGSASSLVDNNDADSPELTAQLKRVALQGLDGSGTLTGDFVNVYSKAKTKNKSNVFHYTRSDDRFEDVMAYYHIDRLQRYIQSLGFTNINNRSITANVNTYKGDNSFYSPTKKDLTFGSGGVDDAEDAGVIAHEYGHSMQDNQVPGFGDSIEGGSMGEGFGDYLGAVYEDALSGNSFGRACVAEWDATSYSAGDPPCLRRLDENKVYPKDAIGEVHADGEIWSQPLYELANALGRDAATTIILQSHWSLTPNASFNEGARAIKQADELLNRGKNGKLIDRIFNARGLSTK
ncbi:Zn-dependent metalloprotease [Fictibacillus solisalsi]|uniref:Zn-dependent metalloprotease n=1 Tax=Fictibacillus solisalsi TaxID=459525 RepID=A0A1G9THC0_9BACL|nr:Zn-dependent metalloprotease [Fictibacillus solisalsi]